MNVLANHSFARMNGIGNEIVVVDPATLEIVAVLEA